MSKVKQFGIRVHNRGGQDRVLSFDTQEQAEEHMKALRELGLTVHPEPVTAPDEDEKARESRR